MVWNTNYCGFGNSSYWTRRFSKNVEKNWQNSKLIFDSNLKLKDLKEIIAMGHTIGSHTKNHVDLSKIKNKDVLQDEIIVSGKCLKKIFNLNEIKHFAYPYGMSKHFNIDCYKVSKQHYKFIHSGIRGNNYELSHNTILKRDEISPNFSNSLINIILLGGIDFFYLMSQKKN